MARIKIKDLPKDQKVSKEEMKKIRGGIFYPMLPNPIQNPALEEVTLNFSNVEHTYTPQQVDGSKDANVPGKWSPGSGTSS